MRKMKTLVLTTMLALPLAGAAWAQQAPQTAQITVTGEASVQAVPDMATVSLGVTTVAETAAEAMAANTASLAQVIERLKAAGIEPRDLQTASLSLNPNWTGYDSSSNQPQTITGYAASNQLSVRVRDVSKLGAVLDAAITDGANTLNGISFELASPRPVQDQARKAATEDARARAELLAAAAGVKLGRVLSITEGGGYGGPMPMFKADAASAPVPVEAGEIGLTAAVTVTFEIVQ
ncbi:SIMPL domain-containing protein [Paracoccaceae bacterium]